MSELEKVTAQVYDELAVKPMGDTTGDSTHLNLLSALEAMAGVAVTGERFRVKPTELFSHPDPNLSIFNCPDCLEITQRFREALEKDLPTQTR